MPWTSLLTLGSVTFTMVAAEMLPTAVLPTMSADLGVPQARTGMLVSAWALAVVVGTFPLVRLTRRLDSRRVIAAAAAVLGLAGIATATAGSFEVALGSRLLGALACGLLWATVNAHSAALVPPRRLARAIAVVLGGATLGTVLAVPAASAVAGLWGWRVAFVGAGVASALAGAAVLAVVRPTVVAHGSSATTDGIAGHGPAGQASAGQGAGVDRSAPGPSALRPVLVTATLGGLLLVGHFAAYTFVVPLLARTARSTPGGISGLLLAFGVLSAVGTALVGRFGDRRPAAALALAAGAITVVLASLGLLGRSAAVDLALIAVWGVATGAFPPLAQTAIMGAAGARLRTLAGSLIPVTFNLGIAVGAAGGSAVVAARGLGALPLPAAAVALVATVALLRPALPRRRREPGREIEGSARDRESELTTSARAPDLGAPCRAGQPLTEPASRPRTK